MDKLSYQKISYANLPQFSRRTKTKGSWIKSEEKERKKHKKELQIIIYFNLLICPFQMDNELMKRHYKKSKLVHRHQSIKTYTSEATTTF